MLEIILFQPEIPPNTGTIMRLCAATSSRLHLIEPLGFNLSDKSLKRAGMDYLQRVDYFRYPNLQNCLQEIKLQKAKIEYHIYALTTKAKHFYHQVKFGNDDVLIFGPETRGLPINILENINEEHKLKIPMVKNERSLNLAMSVAVVIYEASRQNEFNNIYD